MDQPPLSKFGLSRLLSELKRSHDAYLSRSAGTVAESRWQVIRRILIDLVIIPLCFFLAMELRFEGAIPPERWKGMAGYVLPVTAVYIALNYAFGIYRRRWVYADLEASRLIIETTGLSTVLLLGLNVIYRMVSPSVYSPDTETLPNSVIIITGLLVLISSLGLRYRGQLWYWLSSRRAFRSERVRERVLIVGTDENAIQLPNLLLSKSHRYCREVVGYIYDDPDAKGIKINGLPILGTVHEAGEIVRNYYIDIVIVAGSMATRQNLRELIKACQDISVQIQVLPNVDELMDCFYQNPLSLHLSSVEEILGRPSIGEDGDRAREVVEGKVVLVTGAAGSIGSELCHKLCAFQPHQIVALDNNETGLFQLNMDLANHSTVPITPILADITDRAKLYRIFKQYKPHLVFHTAAYKHVPMAEAHPDEAIRVNIFGTVNLSEIAHESKVERFVFISTDKAVEPAGVMGASKRIGELWLRAQQQGSDTLFTIVRFGNVIGSRGSVLPIFIKQIQNGGPVTITHPQMKRFFISIGDATELVLQAATFSRGGDVFMLDMGEEIQIQDLAERLIRLRGLRIQRDIAINYTGIRPGEKLAEKLSYQDEKPLVTPNPHIFCLASEGDQLLDRQLLRQAIHELTASLNKTEPMTGLSAQVIKAALANYSIQPDRLPVQTHLIDSPALRAIDKVQEFAD